MITVNLPGLIAPVLAYLWFGWKMAVLVVLVMTKIEFSFRKKP